MQEEENTAEVVGTTSSEGYI